MERRKPQGDRRGKDDEYENRNAYERRRLSGTERGARGVAKTLYNEMGKGVTLYGIRDGYRGLIEGDYHEMKPDDFSDILTLGGTILGTSRQPFKQMQRPEEDSEQTRLDKMLKTVKKAGFDCLVILGGNGTHKTANLLRENGVNVVTLPKTIDNDLWGTELTFGFQSAVNIASEVIDSIHSTAFFPLARVHRRDHGPQGRLADAARGHRFGRGRHRHPGDPVFREKRLRRPSKSVRRTASASRSSRSRRARSAARRRP